MHTSYTTPYSQVEQVDHLPTHGQACRSCLGPSKTIGLHSKLLHCGHLRQTPARETNTDQTHAEVSEKWAVILSRLKKVMNKEPSTLQYAPIRPGSRWVRGIPRSHHSPTSRMIHCPTQTTPHDCSLPATYHR